MYNLYLSVIKYSSALFQDPKALVDLEQKGNGTLESRTVTVCSGLDFVNINYTPLIARDPEIAKVGLQCTDYGILVAH